MDSTNLVPDTSSDPIAFPRLTPEDLALLKPLATPCTYEDGQTVFRAGSADLDLFVVEFNFSRSKVYPFAPIVRAIDAISRAKVSLPSRRACLSGPIS